MAISITMQLYVYVHTKFGNTKIIKSKFGKIYVSTGSWKIIEIHDIVFIHLFDQNYLR